MEVKGPLSDLNLRGSFFWFCSQSISYSLTSSFPVFRHESYSLLDFSFALFVKPFEQCRNLDLEFCMALMESPYCFQVFHSPLYSSVCPFKFSFSFSLSSNKISIAKFTIKSCKLSMLQALNPSSKPILVQLANIYLIGKAFQRTLFSLKNISWSLN